MKIYKVLLIGLLFILMVFQAQAAYLKNVPQKLRQPDGTILNCLATGDERYNWLHDANNFTIVQDPVTGYYVFAKLSGSKLVPTTLVAGQSDPAAAGLEPGINLNAEEVYRLTKDRFRIPELKGSASVTTTGTINNIVVFIRFSDQAEFTAFIDSYNNEFNGASNASMVRYFHEVSKSQLTINSTFYPGTNGGNTVVSYQDANLRNYYRTYNAATNLIGYQTEEERTTREMTLLKNASLAVGAELAASGLDFDQDNDG
ncbi:MAG: hypothetical protein WCW62_09030, partial [Bacteroidales bacterium]